MASFDEKPLFEFDTVREWEEYLAGDPSPDGVRLRLRRKKSTKPGFTYDDALDVALCHGWIDGQVKGLDEDYHLQAFTPRRRASPWSQRNQDHVARLIAEGRMRPAGQAEIDRAKADGRWEAAYRVKDAPVPDDFQAALDASPKAAAFFAALTGATRFAFLFRLVNLKRPESRERRIRDYIERLERGETLG